MSGAGRIGIPPPAPLGKGGVREGEGLVLVVLDDVTDLGSCREVLPTANRFRVLMTTRLRSLDTNFVEIRLDVLSPEAALELLTALVGEKRVGLTSPPAPLLQGEGSKSNSLSPPFPRREGGLGGLGFSDAFGTSPPAPLLRGEGSKSPSPSVSPPFPAREGGLGGLGLSDALQLYPDVATSLHNLAALYYSQGRYAEAEPLLVQALELSERVLGDGHPNTMTVRQNLALFWRQSNTGNS